MKKSIDLMFTVYGEESGEMSSYKTLKEAKKFIKSLYKFDKRHNIKDTYYIEVEEVEEGE